MHETITQSTVEVKQKHCNTSPPVLIQKLYSNKTLFFIFYKYLSKKIIILLILQEEGVREKD